MERRSNEISPDQEMGLDRKIYGEDRHVMVGIGKYMLRTDMLWLG